MRSVEFRYRIISLSTFFISLIIVILPFHAFLTVWFASNFGHYVLIRLWKEFLVLFLSVISIIYLILNKKLRQIIFHNKLIWLILAYGIIDLLVSFYHFFIVKNISFKALSYGLLDDLRFLVFFVICMIFTLKTERLAKRWLKFIIWPAFIVILFGVFQVFILPANFLTHFGYGLKFIMPYQTVNNNPHYIRILSTLRGSDLLGAYLILPISTLIILSLRHPKSWLWLKLTILGLGLIVLLFSYSRAAWLGQILALVFILIIEYRRQITNLFKKINKIILVGLGLVLLAIIIFGGLKISHSHTFQSVIFHYQGNQSSKNSSDYLHLLAIKDGLNYMINHPLGTGAGSSGPASIYNTRSKARITENYYLMVGEETGWLGMIAFILINLYLGLLLYRNKQSDLAFSLFISLIGLSFVCLLSLEWTDDTMTYIWWGLAGISIAELYRSKRHINKQDLLV